MNWALPRRNPKTMKRKKHRLLLTRTGCFLPESTLSQPAVMPVWAIQLTPNYVGRPCISTFSTIRISSPNFAPVPASATSLCWAHEVAHHLLGHTTRAYYLYREPGQSEALKTTSENAIDIPERHLHELEADALALWLIIKKGEIHDADGLRIIFKVLSQTLPYYDRDLESDTHPSFAVRERMLERQWEKLRKPDYLKRYLASNVKPGRNLRSIDRKGQPY